MIKRPDVSGLVTTISLTAAETKTPIVNDIYIYKQNAKICRFP